MRPPVSSLFLELPALPDGWAELAWAAAFALWVLVGVYMAVRELWPRVMLWWARFARPPRTRDRWLADDAAVLVVADTRRGGCVAYTEVRAEGARGPIWLNDQEAWGDLLEARDAVPIVLVGQGTEGGKRPERSASSSG